MDEYLDSVTQHEIRELHDEIQADVDQELAVRYSLARRRQVEDATELDLVQFLMSRGGNA